MCQVGESSKQAGSGKIGRKGIGFDLPDHRLRDRRHRSALLLTRRRAASLATSCRRGSSSRSSTCRRATTRCSSELARDDGGGGTLLVCAFASRVRGTDLLRDFEFDGLSLAFLKNLEKISFVSHAAADGGGAPRRR